MFRSTLAALLLFASAWSPVAAQTLSGGRSHHFNASQAGNGAVNCPAWCQKNRAPDQQQMCLKRCEAKPKSKKMISDSYGLFSRTVRQQLQPSHDRISCCRRRAAMVGEQRQVPV
jgi:hypothetical protein